MSTLDLKLFLHYGEYIEQEIDGAAELQGADVILANRLMKNGVKEKTGLGGYALITDAAVEAMDAEKLTVDMTAHSESYEHFDEVPMRIWNLPEIWEAEKQRRREEISPDHAWVTESIDVSTPPWVTWDCATDAERKRRYYDMISVERTDDLGGPVGEGTQYHCRHEMGDVRFTFTDWYPPEHFSSDEVAFEIPIQFTMQILAKDSGSTIRVMYGEPQVGDKDELEPLFRGASRDALARLAEMLESKHKQ